MCDRERVCVGSVSVRVMCANVLYECDGDIALMVVAVMCVCVCVCV